MNKKQQNEIDVLRAHAVAAALNRAKPVRRGSGALYEVEYDAWFKCVRHVETVVCTADGVSITAFHALCGVEP